MAINNSFIDTSFFVEIVVIFPRKNLVLRE